MLTRALPIALVYIFAVLFFSGCASRTPQTYLSYYQIQAPHVDDFVACKSSGCRKKSWLAYSAEEWRSIRSIFEPATSNATEERERIRIAIAMMEQIIGPKNGTAHDNPRNQVIGSRGNQLDCIAEATNTTIGLLLLEKEGLLRFHTTGYPQHRGFTRLMLPHNTASIIELSNNTHYVVDSWFHAGGEMPEIVTVDRWKAGYRPN